MNDKEFLNLVTSRQSVRGYTADPVSQEQVMACIEAARLAPSACNGQPWKFIVINDPELRKKVGAETSDRVLPMNHFIFQAPVIVAVVMERANITSQIGQVLKGKEFPLIDIGIAVEHFCLQACSLGLGTCIIGWFHEERIKKTLNIPRNKRLALLITLGVPSDKQIRPKKRKTVEDITSFNIY
ncbi:MAG: NAD(P)H nitroreductase [Candidatus Methanofastidiosa archaeon]|nr:NAD(P)H nitroreductase [Candidatus Methanofastidiosa archaeon]